MKAFRLAPLFAALTIVAGCASGPPAPSLAQRDQLAPGPVLRVGVVYAPEGSTFFVVRNNAGEPLGVTVELAHALGRAIGRQVEFFTVPNSGQVTDALAARDIDVAFMPVDDARRERVNFGPAYFVGENTYLVRGESGIARIEDVDRSGVKVIGIAGTTTIRTSTRLLKNTVPAPVASVDEALAMMRDGRADAFALTHDTLAALAPKVPGARILDGAFHRIDIAVAVPKGRLQALAYVTRWMEDAKASGTVRSAFDRHGFQAARVAPASAAPPVVKP